MNSEADFVLRSYECKYSTVHLGVNAEQVREECDFPSIHFKYTQNSEGTYELFSLCESSAIDAEHMEAGSLSLSGK